MKRKRHIPAPLAAGLLICLLFSLFASELCAQAPESGAGQASGVIGYGPIGFGPAYGVGHEIILGGNIQQIVTRRESGVPAGVHVLVSGSRGVVDVHLGPLVSAGEKGGSL